MYNWFAVFIGGGLGSIVRYGISQWINHQSKVPFPLATFISNLLSCLILAISLAAFNEKLIQQPTVRLLLIVGFCGGFSTFSSFSFETVELIKSGNMAYAIANILISVLVCISIVYFILKNH